jgi:hypothetical protein
VAIRVLGARAVFLHAARERTEHLAPDKRLIAFDNARNVPDLDAAPVRIVEQEQMRP